ncbi:retinal-specific phospholipid-transporting ATPase ABCA4 [Dermacentor silvarum]|uniref:retinal-specific phospholipid-transporting ATPase ABCA4 n=1 Tax=Dermacentor silvarum TaxID=543639 RepID=UPI002100D672|nr:retinal-specific phospholipid-transporting ATPase ABCA4 [Dermacentor silvarum]
MEEESDVSEVTAFIQRIRPSAEVYMERRRAVVYTIGYPGTTSLIDLLRELETNQKKLGITRIGVNAASLEDVMLRVHSEKSEFLMDDGAHSTMSRLDMQGRTQAVASTLFIRQVDALARKKFASGRRILGMHVILVSIQLVIVGFMVAYVSSHYPFVQMHRLHTVGNALDTLRVISVSKGRDFFLSLDFDRLSQEMHAVVLKVRLMVGALLPVAMALSISMRVFLPLQERKSEAKHLQLMTGLSPARYWTITFLIDMVYHVFTTLILLTPFFIPTRSDTVCQTFTYMGPFFSLIFMFGWSFVPITYLTSFMTDQRIAGYVTLVFSAFFFGSVTNSYMDMVGPSTVSKFRPSSWTSEISELLMVPLRLLPQYAVAHGASEVQASFSEHAACCRLHRALLWYICTVPLDSYPEAQRPFASRIMHCCQADCRNGSECVTMEPLRSSWNVLSSGWDLLMMFLSGILYLAAAVSLEKHLGLHHYLKPEPHLRHHVPTQLTNVETRHPSVTEEAEIVNKLITGRLPLVQEKTGDNPHHVTGLVVSELCLKTCGLGPLSFHVEQGEVFGIIGTEGSGRSSLLAAIAGEEALTKGSLLFNGASSTVNKAEYQRQIGYCPKNNPMVTRLTSHEMLQLIARLRGLPSTAIEEEVSFIEGKVGLRNVRDERVDKLRPCDKRKLSVGLALVGSPKLVILNECTREIDPMSRGRLFRCIEKMHSCAQTSMVFASHCLRECDSFCDRVAVLESGEFQVIGETSLLKEGCKQRFTVTVRLTKDKVQEGDYIKTVNRVMKEQFPSSLISDIRMDMLQYTVKDTAIPWSDVFVRMEKINDELNLEDYVVCEASLADVFLGFSHERKVVDFSGADMRIYSDSEPIEVFSDVPPTPTLLRQ